MYSIWNGTAASNGRIEQGSQWEDKNAPGFTGCLTYRWLCILCVVVVAGQQATTPNTCDLLFPTVSFVAHLSPAYLL